MHRIALLVLLWALPAAAFAEQILEGYTVVSGRDYAFELKAPRGWYLDNRSGRDQGINVVFYPRGYAWDTAPAVCYVRVRTIGGKILRIEDQVEDTLRTLRENGAANPQAHLETTITTQDATKARVYYFHGDRFGNLEATAYVQAGKSIHFMTLSAHDETAFRNALSAFEALVSSYEDLAKPASPAASR